jgi:hypothetical protein
MVVFNQNSFVLPRVEKSQFINLLRLGLEFDRVQRTYKIKNYNNIKKLIDTLSIILNDSNIFFLQTCFICKKDFSCSNCSYQNICTTKNLPFECVCSSCLKKEKNSEKLF